MNVLTSVGFKTAASNQTEPTVLFRVFNRVAIITLNRPAVLNALSHEMVLELESLIERCRVDAGIVAVVLRGAGEKGFCAGGDVRALYRMAEAGDPSWQQFFVDEYRLDFALHQFPKLLVVLMDGITMGGGMGLAQGASLRVVTERTQVAMPETRIGFVPDVGATRFLSALPIELALYLGLTAQTMSGADAIRCGLADAYAPSSSLHAFEKQLQLLDTRDVRQSLKDVFVSPSDLAPYAPLDELMPLVRAHFSPQSSIKKIVDSIDRELQRDRPPQEREWLQATLRALGANSPLMLHVTREALLRGRHMTLGACFRMELDLVTRAIEEGDFCEGVRAFMIDKDRSPQWKSRTLDEVCPDLVQGFFSSPWHGEDHPLSCLDNSGDARAFRAN